MMGYRGRRVSTFVEKVRYPVIPKGRKGERAILSVPLVNKHEEVDRRRAGSASITHRK